LLIAILLKFGIFALASTKAHQDLAIAFLHQGQSTLRTNQELPGTYFCLFYCVR